MNEFYLCVSTTLSPCYVMLPEWLGFYVVKAECRSAEHIKIQDGGPPGTSIHALWLVTATYFRPTLETLDFLEIF